MIPKIEVINLHKKFNNRVVLAGINLKVMPGESLVILGGSGTGKSVLLKCILGLYEPDEGVIKIDGVNITDLKGNNREEIMHKIGMLFQGGALFDSLPVWKNVAFELIYNQKIPLPRARTLARGILRSVELGDEVLDLSPAQLSGGMQKRVGLARAIAKNPEILFFDEPTTGLDPMMCGVIDNLIKKCVKQLGATAITITHDIETAKYIADQIAVLKEGQIIWSGTPAALNTAKNAYVQSFINGHSHAPAPIKKRVSRKKTP